jgi:hypothetical protein
MGAGRGWMALREAVQEILATPTEQLVAQAESSARATEGQVEAWSVDSASRELLVRLGIPYMEEDGLEVSIQAEADPQIEYGDRSFYRLGVYYDHEIGIEAGNGEVWAVPLAGDSGEFYVNSSVETYVNVAWRYYWAGYEIGKLSDDFAQFDLLDVFMEYVSGIDVRAAADGAFWRKVIAMP